MGLDDIEGVTKGGSSSSSGSSKKKSPEEDDDKIVIGSDPHKKIFDRERWEEEIKPVLMHEFGMQPNVVLNKPAQRRYEILHEAATWSPRNKSEKQKKLESDKRCDICGVAADNASVVFIGKVPGGEKMTVRSCIHHPAAKVAKEFGHEIGGDDKSNE